MAMKFKVFRRAAFARVTVEGTIESFHLKVVRESVRQLIDQGYTNLVIDLSDASPTMEARFLAAIAPLIAFAALRDGVVVIVSPAPFFIDFLAKTGLEIRVNIVGDRDRALPCLLARIRKRYDHTFFKLLLDREILSKKELKDVVEVYRASGEQTPFGDILLERKHLTIETLLDLLAIAMKTAPHDLEEAPLPADEQPPPSPPTDSAAALLDESLFDPPAQKPPAPAEPPPQPPSPQKSQQASEFVTKSLFGEILVENGFITEQQLKTALDVQQDRDGARLGDILIEKGYIDNDGVFDALRSQVRRRKGSGDDSDHHRPATPVSEFVKPSLFGEILLELGLVTEDQLRLALDVQRDHPERQLGDILVEMDAVTPQQILQAVEEQANRKN